jgi:N-acetylglucosaminyldiphosphoundecaprenol N-acetyl-beta-D-mannosaminyltransferase
MTSISARHRDRVRIGRIWVDAVAHAQALDTIRRLVETHQGGAVFTPNVDHILLAETNREFRLAYRRASLVLADGVPIIWASRLLGAPLPEKLSGSDMVLPIARLAASRRWRVYLLGGNSGVAKIAAERLSKREGVLIVGVDDAFISLDSADAEQHKVVDRIKDAKPDLLFVALGTPKQELWIARHRAELVPTVAIGVGASLDFVAGTLRRTGMAVSAGTRTPTAVAEIFVARTADCSGFDSWNDI